MVIWSLVASPVSADKIRYADSDPTECIRCQFLAETYFPSLSSATNGRVQVTSLFGGVLGSNKENLKLASEGVVEFSSTFVGYHNNIFPAQSAFDLFPRGPSNYAQQLYFYREAYERIPEIKQELAARNLKLVMITPLLHLAFASKKPLTTIQDIEGQNWRAGTKWLLRFLKSSGASPVSVPWGDVYVALETGVIDGVLTNYDALDAAKFYEPAPNLLISPALWMANPMIYVVNLDYWESLSDDLQTSWLGVSREAEVAWGKSLNSSKRDIVTGQRAQGAVVNVMSSEDLADWADTETLELARAIWIKDATAAGLENAANVLEVLKDIHAESMALEIQ